MIWSNPKIKYTWICCYYVATK